MRKGKPFIFNQDLLLFYLSTILTKNWNAEGKLKKHHEQLEELVEERTLELKQSEAKFRNMILNLEEGFYSGTIDGILLDHNPAFNRILGFKEDENLIGSKLPNFWQDPNDRIGYIEELKKKGFVRNYIAHAKKITGEKIILQANTRAIVVCISYLSNKLSKAPMLWLSSMKISS